MAGDLSYDASQNAQQPQAQYAQPQAVRAQPPQPPRPQADQQEALHLLGIDPGIWPIIRQSAALLSRNEDAFIQQLHYDITRLIRGPDKAQAPDMWVFCERMVRSLLWVALTDQPLGVVAGILRQVGAQDWVEGFPDTLYGDVAHAVVQTVHTLCAHDWSASTASAWITYFISIKPHLLAGAQQAITQHAAVQQAAEWEAAAQRAAAEREAARVQALSRDPRGGHTQVVGDVNLESVASLLADEDDENVGYGQIMVSMTRNSRREPPRHQS
ncbi:MAG TPA: hypothetical protein VF482_04400 [Trebonia sp.]